MTIAVLRVSAGGIAIVRTGENTAEAARQAGIASAAAISASLSAGTAEAFAGPTFANTTAGLAGTSSGDFFAVNNGGIVTIYLNNAGTAVVQRDAVTASALASTTPGKGASLVSLENGQTVQDVLDGSAPSSAATAADIIPVARGGANYAVTANSIADLARDDLASTTSGKGASLVVLENGTSVQALSSRLPVFVEDHGASGDGSAIDSDAILAALAAAGPWGTIVFQPNKTYLYDTQFTLQIGQKVALNGATLKRAPQAKTTLTENFSAVGNPASQTIQVADASAFRVGSYITICKPTSQGDDTENRFRADTQSHKIISKTATSLTVQGNFQYAYAIGDEVVTCFIGFYSTAPFVEIYGGTIDGATTKHDAAASGSTANGYQVRGRRWETMSEFRLSGDATHLHHLHFKDIPSDGFLLGGANSKFSNITGENIGGNLSHISGGEPVHGEDCYVDGANRVWIEHDGRAAIAPFGTIGHENGAYAWSQSCRRGTLTRCTAKNARSVFAPPYSPGNDLATISGCIGIDCQMPFYTLTYDTRALGLLIVDCEFSNCGIGQMTRGLDDAPEQNGDVHAAIIDCRFFETAMNFKGCHKLVMRGGFMRFNNPSGGATAIAISDSSNVEIDTMIDGALYGVYLNGLCREIDITLRTHRLGGYAVSAQYVAAGSRGIRVRRGRYVYDEVVKRDDLADWNTPTNVTAIYCCDNMLIEGASAYMAVGATFVDQNSKNGVRVRRNTIETNPTGTVRPVIVRGGTGNIVKSNEITVAIRDDTAGAGVTLADNDTISWVA